ncbi:LOW QUALITY PROTEIN: para-nitrobenzyl esterase-like [Gadus chalcogrammus]|uniref:LOW QUALITY PROTEIN: para-nitrobenzyl esterase-like n=1 Tax=Gadus chalcogrammus TaxID=1042646 RepID=UPI0024C4B10B|nr:LOW QUALITY PROTEIN: para-nitrobenzyl esterase-like [Gadus chalcogrammus]
MNEDTFEIPEGAEYRYLVQEEAEVEVQYVRRRNYVSPLLVLSKGCITLIGLAVLSMLGLAAYLAYLSQTLPRNLARVTTDVGVFEGRHEDGAYSFRGMSYASPPTGRLRWAPPARLTPGNGFGDASRLRGVCPQRDPRTSRRVGSESCLFLNVWTPSLEPDAALPVVVWIHGGYLTSLSGGEPGYAPSARLAAETGVVYVSFNYRLGALGFLALEVLREGSPTNTSGNYGFMDQIAALQWVQRNIHAFGGDPGSVTIFGHSSGGTSVWTLLKSPLAKGLFSAAVVMSGSTVQNASLAKAEADNLVFLRKTDCTDLACLRRLSVSQILQASPWEEYPSWAGDGMMDLPTKGKFTAPWLVVDGHVLPDTPAEGGGGFYNDVPIVVGTTEQEADFSPSSANISLWTWDDYQWFVTDKLKPFGDDLPKDALDLYPSSAPCPTLDRCPERAYTTMVSDMRVTCPSNEEASRAAAALSSPVYRYVVTHTPSSAVNTSGQDLVPYNSRFSFHMLDALAFFDGLGALLEKPLSPNDTEFQLLFRHHLVHFAKTRKMVDEWPEFPSATALLSNRLKVVQSYSDERCRLWQDNGFDAYAWVN